jgi:hypothetical protein
VIVDQAIVAGRKFQRLGERQGGPLRFWYARPSKIM